LIVCFASPSLNHPCSSTNLPSPTIWDPTHTAGGPHDPPLRRHLPVRALRRRHRSQRRPRAPYPRCSAKHCVNHSAAGDDCARWRIELIKRHALERVSLPCHGGADVALVLPPCAQPARSCYSRVAQDGH
jgi:hypothetical protein